MIIPSSINSFFLRETIVLSNGTDIHLMRYGSSQKMARLNALPSMSFSMASVKVLLMLDVV
jgi:hypothetical protein